jgi:hypothetical protein
MQAKWFRSGFNAVAPLTIFAILGLCRPGAAQQVSDSLLHPAALSLSGSPTALEMEPVAPVQGVRPIAFSGTENHHFWDRDNSILFAGSALFSAADFVVTRDNLRSGGQELNPVTRVFAGSTAGLAANFAGETAGVVGLSYFFHKTGHHKLERAVSMLNIGSSATAVGFGLAHR